MVDPGPRPGPEPGPGETTDPDAGRLATADEHRRADTGGSPRGRWRRRVVLSAVAVSMVVYYLIALGNLDGDGRQQAALGPGDRPTDGVTIRLQAVEVDVGAGAFDLRLRPVPRGDLAGQGSRLDRPLHVEVRIPGGPPTTFDFPAQQVVDPMTALVETSTHAYRFPFDEQEATFSLEASSEGEPVPVDVEMVDETAGWVLTGTASADGAGAVDIGLRSEREMLTISFSLFYIAGTAVVALIAVTVIAGAVKRRQVSFERVIWLGAMLVVIPAVRNEMPGVPPVGTAVDLLVFLPSVVVVAIALVTSIALLTVEELGLMPAPAPRE